MESHAKVTGPLFVELRRALAAHRFGPVGTRFGQELLQIVDLERGLWEGRPVGVKTIDALYASGDERTLRRFADRLPAPGLRDEARRRVIRLRIAASSFPEVRDHPRAVEEQLMKSGSFTVSPAEHAPLRAWIKTERLPSPTVLVRQQPWRQAATLLSGHGATASVLPELDLRGALQVELAGLSHPVTTCGSARELDPSPCLDVHLVRLESQSAYFEDTGVFRFIEHTSMRAAVGLSRHARFELLVSVARRPVATLSWPLVFERPEDLVVTTATAGARGPDLLVRVDGRFPRRLVFTVSAGTALLLAVVEATDAAAFHVASRGGQGHGGAAGSSGSTGSSGGTCQDGGPGGDGGPAPLPLMAR